ncbi:putative 5-methylcytosine-specific restriction enzyme, subunit McrB [Sulfurimonas gotlandica GD1]|uniref:Putative 5-methylcytosine-specific restriction enzyme, subunit McrB n=1 Tax=Sulfurimonas gotlandica (strain DSM 19862 / JCM 16533 / GD1) TaxID=929558 RepID=B6BMV3_SULGG|nr:AAA family ATPase [Sulfurimonas gotlandica]EDZ61606.1 ATPase [Sulfurimonas gotlandica GD1]EHP30775.1 putative 5-methylcytosine-specific restriction enzyme, subunit McrB [Sulfurimonas gotlandica GD1]
MDNETKFKKWLEDRVQTQAPINSYPKAIREFIPNKLNELGESKYGNLFLCDDINYLQLILKRLRRGKDLYEFNVETQAQLPSASLKKYIEFLQYNKLIDTIKEFDLNPQDFPLNSAYRFFIIEGNNNKYPIKAICKKIYKDLDLDVDFRTNGAMSKLQQIFTSSKVSFVDINNKVIESHLKIKNIILYGAPGVGKTHNYQNLISMIEDGKNQSEIFSTISQNNKVYLDNETFETIKNEKRVEFVTFHQSYSYEDFIEGFRPNESGNIELEDGIFKNLSDTARKNLEEAKKDKEIISQEKLFKKKIEVFIENLEEEIEKDGYYSITDAAYLTSADIDAFRYNIRRENPTYKYDLRMKFEDLYKFYENNIKSRKDIKSLEGINPLANQHASYFLKVYDKIKDINIDVENNIEKIEQKNYYLVIDEINRGNISKIFGELITLIEEDKRDIYEVTLPYSKEKFKVPSNLYIIATMNSTDKSIATIDIALRRRFTFLKMQPNQDLINYPDAKKLFNELNIFIEEKLSEDYKLGHSYFMKVENKEDLEFVKEYKIKPLLEEYFYADEDNYKKAIEILNKNETKAENE